MEDKVQVKLLEDIYERRGKGKVILVGAKGDIVTLIGDHINILIVENADNYKFHVRTELTDYKTK